MSEEPKQRAQSSPEDAPSLDLPTRPTIPCATDLRDAHILLSLAVMNQRTFGRPPKPEILTGRLPANQLNYHIFS